MTKQYRRIWLFFLVGLGSMAVGGLMWSSFNVLGIPPLLAGFLLFNQGWHCSGLDPIPALRPLALEPIDD